MFSGQFLSGKIPPFQCGYFAFWNCFVVLVPISIRFEGSGDELIPQIPWLCFVIVWVKWNGTRYGLTTTDQSENRIPYDWSMCIGYSCLASIRILFLTGFVCCVFVVFYQDLSQTRENILPKLLSSNRISLIFVKTQEKLLEQWCFFVRSGLCFCWPCSWRR